MIEEDKGKLDLLLRPQERDDYSDRPLVVTWTGDTHEETDVLPDNKLKTRGDDELDVLLDKEKSTQELTLIGGE